MKLYAESKLFDLKAEATVLSLKHKIFDGGKEEYVVGFANENSELVLYDTTVFGVMNSDFTKVKVLNLKTGKVSTKSAEIDKLVLYDEKNAVQRFNKKSGEVVMIINRLKTRFDDTLYFAYFGDRLSFPGFATINNKYAYYKPLPLVNSVRLIWLQKDLNIAPENLHKKLTVTYKVEDEAVYEEEVYYGSWGTYAGKQFKLGFELDNNPDDGFYDKDNNYDIDSFYIHQFGMYDFVKNNMHLDSMIFASDYEPIVEDKVYNAILYYKDYAKVEYKYYTGVVSTSRGEEVLAETSQIVYAGVGSKFDYDLYYTESDQIEGFSADNPTGPFINSYVKFKNWDLSAFGTDGIVPKVGEDETLVVQAVYDYIPFAYNVIVPALYDKDNPDVLLLGEQRYSFMTTFGVVPEMDLQTYPLHKIIFEETVLGETQSFYEPQFANGPRTVKAKWTNTNVYDVHVVNHLSEVIATMEGVVHGSDASSILTSESVIEFLNKYSEYKMSNNNFTNKFVGWAQEDLLKKVNSNIYLFPIFEIVYNTTLIKIDGNGGEIPAHMQYSAKNGIELVQGKEWATDDSFLQNYAPTTRTKDGVIQNFSGWIIDKSQEGIWTYVAQYTEAQYSLTFLADGIITVFDSEGKSSNEVVEAEFSNGSKTIVIAGTNAEIVSHANNIEASSIEKPVLPENSPYTFYRWQILAIGNEWQAVPEYKLNDGVATIIFDIGKGTFDGKTDKYVETIEVPGGKSFSITIGDCFEPVLSMFDDCAWYDVINDKYVCPKCAYFDDKYYYTLGYWQDSNGIKLEDSQQFTLSVGSVLNLKYVYTTNERVFLTTFEVNADKGVYNESMLGVDGNYKDFNGKNGDVLAKEDIPVAIKSAEELSLYYYEFKHWAVVNENGEATGEIGLDSMFTNNYHYVPVFERKLREIVITFDAGENGHFLSNGERYRSITLGAGSVLNDFGEIPVYKSTSKYYNVFFDSWSYYEGITLTNDSTINAYSKKVRNAESTDKPIGVTISKNGVTEDIGVGHLGGYEYDPEENYLFVKESGFVITSDNNTVDLDIEIDAEDITLKDISLKSHDAIGVINQKCHIKIEGTVELSVSNYAVRDYIGSSAIVIEGKTSNSKLIIKNNDNMPEDTDGFISFVCGNDVTVKNLHIEVSINSVITQPIYVFYTESENGKFEMISSFVSVNITQNNKDNYAVYLVGESTFNKDESSQFACTGCQQINK